MSNSLLSSCACVCSVTLSHLLCAAEGGSLSDILKDSGPLDEPSTAYVMRELLTALAYLHDERYSLA